MPKSGTHTAVYILVSHDAVNLILWKNMKILLYRWYPIYYTLHNFRIQGTPKYIRQNIVQNKNLQHLQSYDVIITLPKK